MSNRLVGKLSQPPSSRRKRRASDRVRREPSERAQPFPAARAAASDDTGSVDSAAVHPLLLSLGQLIGLLAVDAGSASFRAEWFQSPLEVTRSSVRNNPAALIDTITQLLGEVGGNGLGIPTKDSALLGTWYPIQVGGKPIGLYLVAYPDPDNDQIQVIGLGTLARWEHAPATTTVGPKGIVAEAWGMLPLVALGAGELTLALGNPKNPISAGLAIEGQNEQPLFEGVGISLGGVKASAALELGSNSHSNAGDFSLGPVDLSLVFTALKLPDASEAKDISLVELGALSGDEKLATIVSLALSALAEGQPQNSKLPYVLPALGLASSYPGAAAEIPLLGWTAMVEAATAGENPATPLLTWLVELISEPLRAQAWLTAVGRSFGASGTVVATGDGTRSSPLAISLASVAGVGSLELTLGSEVAKDGTRSLFPGLAFRTNRISVGGPVALVGEAELELIDIRVSPSGGTSAQGPGSLRGRGTILLANSDAQQPLFSGAIAGDQYVFGSLRAGLSLSDGLQITPHFSLAGLQTPQGNYAELNLLDVQKVAQLAADALIAEIVSALNQLLGLDQGQPVFGTSVAALLGLTPPQLPAGVSWPSTLAPPLSAAKLVSTMSDPLGAIGDYYRDLLSTPLNGTPAFTYVLKSFGSLFALAGAQVTVSGDGSASSPWRASLAAAAGVSLTAYQSLDGSTPQLSLGLALNAELALAGAPTIALGLAADLLRIRLPAAGTTLAGLPGDSVWLAGVSASLSIPDKLSSASVLGASVQIQGAELSAGWQQSSGWNWDLQVDSPALIVGATELGLQTLTFSDSASLDRLVDEQAAEFAPLLVQLLGLFVARTELRAALALDGVLGLLPSLSNYLPASLAWPADMPVLTPTGFDDPLGLLKSHVAALTADPEKLRAAARIIGWALAGSGDGPSILGDGTRASPLRIPLTFASGIDVRVWSGASGALGLGLGRAGASSLSSLQIDSDVSLLALEIAVGGSGELDPASNAIPVPSLTLQATAQGGVLGVTSNGTKVKGVSGGARFGIDSGALTVTPLVYVLTDSGGSIELALAADGSDSTAAQQAFFEALNLAFQQVCADLAPNETFQRVYRVLSGLDVVVPPSTARTTGVSAAGWNGLFASPSSWLRDRSVALLSDADARADFITLLQLLLGISTPLGVPPAILETLHALGFLNGAELGYVVKPQAVVEFAAAPMKTLATRVESLLSSSEAVAELVSALAPEAGSFGPFAYSIVESRTVLVQITDAHAFELGSLLALTGSLSLDLRNERVTAALRAYVPDIRAAVVPSLSYVLGDELDALALTVQATWGDSGTPSPVALTLYPFSQEVFISQVKALGPTQALSAFASQVLDRYVLQPYPFARALLTGLGLVVDSGGVQTMKSLLGLFEHPLDWLLSDAVLGANGQLDLGALARMLNALPQRSVTGNGIVVSRDPKKPLVQVTGLPYQVALGFSVDDASTQFSVSFAVAQLAVANASATLDLHAGLTLNQSFQPGVSVSGTLTETSAQVFVSAGFQNGSPSLSLGKNPSPTLTLLPFSGWQALIEAASSVAIQLLIQELTDKLLSELAKDPSTAPFVAKLRAAASDLKLAQLVTALSTPTDPNAMLEAALAWLAARLDADDASQTVDAVVTLLAGQLPGSVASAPGEPGLLSWTPSPMVPLSVLLGRNAAGLLGLWADVSIPDNPVLVAKIDRTGVGFSPGSKNPVTFSLGISGLVPIVSAQSGPALAFVYDAQAQRVRLTLDPEQNAGAASSLAVELLPDFFSGKPETVPDWLLQVLLKVLPRYASIVLLGLDAVKSWLDSGIVAVPQGAPTPGDLLVGAQLLTRLDGGKYALRSLDELESLTPETFLGGLLKALISKQFQLLSFESGGGLWLEQDQTLGYGARIQAPDLSLTALPYVTFQLGGNDKDWIAGAGGPSTAAGASVYVPIPDTTPQFDKLTLALINVGLDIHGKNQSPLVKLSRFSLDQVSPRALFQIGFSDPAHPVFGGSLELNGLGFAAAPNSLPQGAQLNPVAANLLGSGSSSDTSDNPATNPTFSAFAGYVQKLNAGFLDSSGALVDQVLVRVQESFGPINVQQIGLGWKGAPAEQLSILFTGGVSVGPLSVQVIDLSLGLHVRAPLDLSSYSLDLRGLAVDFNSGSVQIAGGLVKQESGANAVYNGAILAKVGTFSLTAVGSYGMVQEDPPNAEPRSPSFFVFAASGTPLGGPPAFFVQGFAGGFAYNRSLTLPAADEVADYILVRAAKDPSSIFGVDPSPAAALATLSEEVAPSVGEYWVAAGVHFTTFELLDSVALLLLEFGSSFAIDLLGASSISLPPLENDPSKALVFVELGLIVRIAPTEGLVAAQAQITPNSFVLDRECKLTGGFAFFLWWPPNEHAGDFVLTLGGYNPNYDAPSHYPTVPRLGLSWPLSTPIGTLSILGNAYFALTPNAVMAGGHLDVQWESGPLFAWLKAGADFIIGWKPFFYDVAIEVSVGAGFTTKIFGTTVTLKAELGAALQLWGPPTRGKVRVSWYVISFTIPFGDQAKDLKTNPLGSWQEFEQNFLPPGTPPPAEQALLAAEPLTSTQQNVLKVQVPSGLLKQDSPTEGWVIKRVGFELRVESAVPASSIVAGALPALKSSAALGVRPMDISSLKSEISYEIRPKSGGDPLPLGDDVFSLTPYTQGSPQALWDPAPMQNTQVPASSAVVPDSLVAAGLAGDQFLDENPVGPMAISVFDSEEIKPLPLPLSTRSPYSPSDPLPQTSPLQTIADSVMSDGVVRSRNQVLGALARQGLLAPLSPDLSVLAKQTSNIFQAPPVLAELCETLAPAPAPATKLTSPTASAGAVARRAPRTARLLGGAHRYRARNAAPAASLTGAHGFAFARWLPAPRLQSGANHHEGSVTVWSLDRGYSQVARISGGLPVELLGFDRRLEPVHRSLGVDAVELPAELDHVVVCGVEQLRSHAAGWRAGQPLVRINARYLLGSGCLLKPQAILRARRIGERGIVHVEDLARHNHVVTAEGRRRGWLTTWLPVELTQLYVHVKGDPSELAVRIVGTSEDGSESTSELATSAPDQLVASARGVTLRVARLPGHSACAQHRHWVRVMTHAGEHAQVVGVEAFSDAAREELARAAGLPRASSLNRRASVEFLPQAVQR